MVSLLKVRKCEATMFLFLLPWYVKNSIPVHHPTSLSSSLIFISHQIDSSTIKFSETPKFVAMVADCLYLLCHGNQDRKLVVLACEGPKELIQVRAQKKNLRLDSY